MQLYWHEKWLFRAGIFAALLAAVPDFFYALGGALSGLLTWPYDIVASMVPYGYVIFYLQHSCYGAVEPVPWRIFYFTMSAGLLWLAVRRSILFRQKPPGPMSPFDDDRPC